MQEFLGHKWKQVLLLLGNIQVVFYQKISYWRIFSVALTSNQQQADTGTKMFILLLAQKVELFQKEYLLKFLNTYRGLVKIGPKAYKTQNYSQCDSLLIGKTSSANTFPYIEAKIVIHKLNMKHLHRVLQKNNYFIYYNVGLNSEEAVSLMVNGFCKEVFNELPLEFASEADRLLSLKLEGSVG